MKKLLALVLALTMAVSMAACASAEPEGQKTPLADPLEKIVEDIYAAQPVEFGVASIPVDVTDTEWALKSYTGLTSGDSVKEVIASEAMIGSIPYSLVLVRLNDGADAKAVAEEMKSGIDQRKWICVEADDMLVSGYCDVVMLIMVGSEYAESGVTAQAMTDAFAKVCGAELDFTI